jgi:hypothetical protein
LVHKGANFQRTIHRQKTGVDGGPSAAIILCPAELVFKASF